MAKVVLDSFHKVLSMSAESNPIHVCGSPFAEKVALGCRRNNMSRSTDRFGIFASTPYPCPPAQVQGAKSHPISALLPFAGQARHINNKNSALFPAGVRGKLRLAMDVAGEKLRIP